MQFRFTQEIYVTNESIELIFNENMNIKIPNGTLWIPLTNNHESNAAILYGEMEYVADIIHESEFGARGRAFKNAVTGYKVYMGGINLYEKSSEATLSDINAHNYLGEEEFLTSAKANLENYGKLDLNDSDFKIHKPGEGKIVWILDDETKNVLFVSEKSTGVILGKQVYLLGSNGFVSVNDGTVIVQNDYGKDIIIDRTGIRSPVELRDLGKNISKEIKKALKDL